VPSILSLTDVRTAMRETIQLGPATPNLAAGPELASIYLLVTRMSMRRFLARPETTPADDAETRGHGLHPIQSSPKLAGSRRGVEGGDHPRY